MEAINDLAAHVNDRDPVAAMLPSHRMLIKNLMNHQIETKLMYNDARRNIPEERLPIIEESIGKEFDKTELDKLMKRLNVQSRRELDDKLRSMGSSLEHEKRAFMQQMLGQEWVGQQVKADEEITHEQMLQWYQTHLSHFETPCRARWEELMVRIAKYPSKADAYAAIARMGNQVLAGTPLAQVARRSPTARRPRRAGSATGPAREASRPKRSTRRCLACRSGNSVPFWRARPASTSSAYWTAGRSRGSLSPTSRTKSKRRFATRESRRGTRSISPSSAARRRFRPSSTISTPQPNACRIATKRRDTKTSAGTKSPRPRRRNNGFRRLSSAAPTVPGIRSNCWIGGTSPPLLTAPHPVVQWGSRKRVAQNSATWARNNQ